MINRGQTTILFSLVLGVLLLFTLTALEVGRIYLAKVKVNPCVHSMRSSVMADYNEKLFERYHLLFMDPTYGTGSEAVLEEKITDYLETSLNGEEETVLYQFQVEEVALSDKETIFFNNMKLLKQQIKDYESTAGMVNRVKSVFEKIGGDNTQLENAATETEINARELDVSSSNTEVEKETTSLKEEDYKDPREVLQESLRLGMLSLVAPDKTYSKNKIEIKNAPSKDFQEEVENEKDNHFEDIGYLNALLDDAKKEGFFDQLVENMYFSSYVISHFSNGIEKKNDSVMQCEVEYILKGKDNEYDNMEAVVEEMTWLRMPINYAYLLTDMEKKSQALTLATAICALTGTEPFVEVVKYLLLACWAYGESIQEMKVLLSGDRIPYIKTKETWYTDLESLAAVHNIEQQENGLSYKDFLAILLAKKTDASLDMGYARMLDVMQINLQQYYTTLRISDCVGAMTFQGKISVNPLFQQSNEDGVYDYYFREELSYEQ